jgi:aspartyl-tRNA(Asn)/glutamyl-tRNA(Gln) amidotransferase subunit A
MARYILGEDYVRALNGRTVLTREVDAALAGYDAILLPTLPIPAPPIGAASVEIGSEKVPVRSLMLRLTQLFNVTGHPALTVPCGSTSDRLPIGLQLVGARHHTELLLRVALAVESVLA